MRVDPRLEQFTALIEQQRSRQSSVSNADRSQSLTTENRFNSQLASAKQNAAAYLSPAERARAAMAARNPALAAKIEHARMLQANRSVQAAEMTTSTARIGSNYAGRTAEPAPVTRDLLAVPTRPVTTPGLGMSVDTYA